MHFAAYKKCLLHLRSKNILLIIFAFRLYNSTFALFLFLHIAVVSFLKQFLQHIVLTKDHRNIELFKDNKLQMQNLTCKS